MPAKAISLFEPAILSRAVGDSFKKLDPRHVVKNPVMFVVEVTSLLTTVLGFIALKEGKGAEAAWTLHVSAWLWFTVVFANFSEAIAEGRGKAQADSLRKLRKETVARKLMDDGTEVKVDAARLRKNERVVCEAGDFIPVDGEVVEGVASVDESAVTGESAPVIRAAGGDRSAVTGGTRVLSDRIVIRVTADPGETFLDRMIGLVEGAKRQKTPNEIALHILLVGFTIVFLVATATLLPFAIYSGVKDADISVTALVALLVCLIPTTIGGLLPAIGIAGMDRLIQKNVIAMSGRAVEASGDVDVLLLDKTGTITLGNRQASEFIPAPGVSERELADAAQLSSLADETPEGRSIVVLAKQKFQIRERHLSELGARFVPFSALTRMSGCDTGACAIRKGAVEAIRDFVKEKGGDLPAEVLEAANRISSKGGTPLAVATDSRVLGIVALKDVVKTGIKERFARFRAMGIRTVMITGDNPRTASAIAEEAGVDDFMAEATPEAKLARIRKEQGEGRLVAMTGDGTNDAPALAQADVGVAMNTGTQAAREAGNMVDLDSNPTKLLEVVEVGKQLLMTRGALTTFSIANDVAKYFAILPAMFQRKFPPLKALNVMGLASPESAILSAVIFNAIVIVFLIPLALRGVTYRPIGAGALLRRNLIFYGFGGVIAPFVGIWLIDLAIRWIPGLS
ncbi:MAG TPA: potassium-transporting ATPase subunit KdpB [Planctomycetota bacterium]|nr:potassium-transporting ATPase subunit KdpB [Planctomycetota bacterium]